MPTTITVVDEVNYFLPEDRVEAHAGILKVLHSVGDTYIDAYGISERSYVDQIILADEAGVTISLNVDKVQASGPTCRPMLQRIVDAFARRGKSLVTITTAGPHSDVPGDIYHLKTMVSNSDDDGDDYCVEGSTNFTHPACSEANTLRIFRSNAWAQKAVNNHLSVRYWAWANHPAWQIKPTVAPSIIAEGTPCTT